MPAVKSKRAAKPAPRLVNYDDAAVYAKVSARTVARWATAGRITAHKEGASPRVLVDLNEIDEVIDGAR